MQLGREGAVDTLCFDRPAALNAIDVSMAEALLAAAEQLAADVTTRAVVLSGAGRGFVAGGASRRCTATRKVLERTGLKVSDLDVIESNEAFAAQACAVIKELGLEPAKVNPNGSGSSLGHPFGATGAIIMTKAIAELHRIGGGQGIAAIFESV